MGASWLQPQPKTRHPTHDCVSTFDNTIIVRYADTAILGVIRGEDEASYRCSQQNYCLHNLILNLEKTRQTKIGFMQPLLPKGTEVEKADSHKFTRLQGIQPQLVRAHHCPYYHYPYKPRKASTLSGCSGRPGWAPDYSHWPTRVWWRSSSLSMVQKHPPGREVSEWREEESRVKTGVWLPVWKAHG